MKKYTKLFVSIIAVLVLLLIISSAFYRALGEAKKNERYYQKKWCDAKNGRMDVVLFDDKGSTRVYADCVTKDFAVEVDFARKWAEGLGQALRYARLTKKQAAVLLIWKTRLDRWQAINLQRDIKHYGLPVTVLMIQAE
jgi:hypothetical protein